MKKTMDKIELIIEVVIAVLGIAKMISVINFELLSPIMGYVTAGMMAIVITLVTMIKATEF